MNILILNWRDIKNPNSGGAEILTHEIAKRWVKFGNSVTLFSSYFNGAKKDETIDGVKIIREGHPDARFLFSSVHFLAFKYYLKNKNKVDAVVDEVHGIPFFTPWYVGKKKVVLICEVASNLWIKMFGSFFGFLGRTMEWLYLRFIYKDIPYLTISNSTKEELIKEGVNSQSITVLPMGLTVPKNIKKIEKEKEPTLIFVGRLTKSKGIEDAIKAFEKVLEMNLNAKLWIVGSGEKGYIDKLKQMAKKPNLFRKIKFWGFVDNEKKFELMGRAHVLLAPSMKEGWGLTVPEAGMVGTPAIGYNVPGLKDVIKNGEAGYLTIRNNPMELSVLINKILRNKLEYQKLSKTAKKVSLSYNWNDTARVALSILKK